MRLKKDMNPEALTCSSTWFSALLPTTGQTPFSLISSVLDPEEYDRWDMLLWNKSPSRKRDPGDCLVSSMETDLRIGPFDTALWLGHSERDKEPPDGGVRLFRSEDFGRWLPSLLSQTPSSRSSPPYVEDNLRCACMFRWRGFLWEQVKGLKIVQGEPISPLWAKKKSLVLGRGVLGVAGVSWALSDLWGVPETLSPSRLFLLFWKRSTFRVISRIFSASPSFSSCSSSSCSLGCFFSGLSCRVQGVAPVLATVLELSSEGDPSTVGSLVFLHLANPSGTLERKLCKTDSKLEGSGSGLDPGQDTVERRLAEKRMLSVRLCLCSAASRSLFSYSHVRRRYRY